MNINDFAEVGPPAPVMPAVVVEIWARVAGDSDLIRIGGMMLTDEDAQPGDGETQRAWLWRQLLSAPEAEEPS